MKKSEMYTLAMVAVITNHEMTVREKLAVIERLMEDRSHAEWSEKREEEKVQEEANA